MVNAKEFSEKLNSHSQSQKKGDTYTIVYRNQKRMSQIFGYLSTPFCSSKNLGAT